MKRSLWQLFNSVTPFFVFWYLAYRLLSVSYFGTLLFAFVAALFAVRTFVILHDCGHGSFFKAQWANDLVGRACGFLCYTPYQAWRHSHALHHATSGDLDRRGEGDVWTLTRSEYQALPRSRRFLYRMYRWPPLLFLLAPTFAFLVLHRIPSMISAYAPRERNSVRMTNAALLLGVGVMVMTIGLTDYVLVQLPTVFISASIGGWLFYVQHQYPDTYWEHHSKWSYLNAAIDGSSFYKLPKVLQWFTGNIGFHHVHHLHPRIPNYFLEPCHNELDDAFTAIQPLTLVSSLKCLRVALWDESRMKLVDFRTHMKTPGNR